MLRFVVCFSLLFATTAGAQTKRVPPRRPAMTAVKPSPTPPPEPWKHSSFNNDAPLRVNYKGEDALKYLEIYERAAKNASKDQFETTAAFEARMSNPSNLISPISLDSDYAFSYEATVTYDADKQAWIFGRPYESCDGPRYSAKVKGIGFCKVGERRFYSEYEGSNAYGAKAKIDKVLGEDISLAISGAQLERAGFKKEKYGESYTLNKLVAMPVSDATTLRGMTLSVLFVGSFSGAQIIEGNSVSIDPTIDRPRDIFIHVSGLPFRLKKVLFYVRETGRVLETVPL